MPGQPKKRAHIAKLIRAGHLPPRKDLIQHYMCAVLDLVDSAREEADSVSPLARVAMGEKIMTIMSKMDDLGLSRLSDDDIKEIMIPVIMKGNEEK